MNLILIEPSLSLSEGRYALTERQQSHINHVIKATSGDILRVGLLGGNLGEGVFQTASADLPAHIHSLQLTQTPPKALPIVLVMALPRPNMLKRTLHNITAMGVKELYLIHSAKVEKSYWQSPVLQPESIHQTLLEGLEQAKDTIIPNYTMVPRFRPFVEDQLPDILRGKLGLLAHPYQAKACPIDLQEPCVLALGPEGGWNEFEVTKWLEAGMSSVHLGDRILKVETVVPVLLSRLYPA
ncbi:16S rRNA (uracil(1498)-N(3))-methyltransferase [Marinomonas posidonica]|uniref:Ribosomal RNA small subunit methyltransferase E n=1 Tax=Marinomonas posidonica (strain CECT 7376 / NCIMB 14433 / IVIA-Po-181) TaxID=491952 RepID=F6D0E3_MARPP|nr:16S rRNA (uracil(1498)-N(3))-methyltransferase [Marinomonas posidonica]AEF53665.1 Ribosomal RNA small subunit methyltransferase E [Marinomonas posidonica IVIA-Po-181]